MPAPDVTSECVASFESLPRRLFLDSSTLQTLQTFGGVVFEWEPLLESRASDVPGLRDNLGALAWIFAINERAMFDFVVSRRTLAEVSAKRDASYSLWALDVYDHWQTRLRERGGLHRPAREGTTVFDDPTLGYLSESDRRLLADAVDYECDAFLTMERRLTMNAAHTEAVSGVRILRPTEFWDLLRPWAALYR